MLQTFITYFYEFIIIFFEATFILSLIPKWKRSLKIIVPVFSSYFIGTTFISTYILFKISNTTLIHCIISTLIFILFSILVFVLSDVKIKTYIYYFATASAFLCCSASIGNLISYFSNIPKEAILFLLGTETLAILYYYLRPILTEASIVITDDWLFRSFVPIFIVGAYVANAFVSSGVSYLVTELALCVISISSYVVSNRTLRLLVSDYKRRELLIKKVATLEMYEKEKTIIDRMNTEIHTIRHDMNHFNKLIYNYIDNEEYETAKAMLCHFDAEIDIISSNLVTYTGVSSLDSLLSYFNSRCIYYTIKFDVRLTYFESYKINEYDLSIILNNALDNALEATKKINSPNKFVSIKDTSNGNNMMIEISNSCDEKSITLDKDNFPINNDEGHGFGLKSIRSIIEENYDGGISISIKDNIFTLRIFY